MEGGPESRWNWKSWRRKGREKRDQQEQHDEVEGAGDPERVGDADVARDGVEAGIAVELEILAGVEDIEACDPEGDGGGEEQDARIEGAANGDPCGGRCYAECEAKYEVRPARETFGIGIEEQDGKSDRREPEREAIQLS